MTDREIRQLRDAAEEAVSACLPILPLEGSHTTGYRVTRTVDPVMMATPEEWLTAAVAVASLHDALRRLR